MIDSNMRDYVGVGGGSAGDGYLNLTVLISRDVDVLPSVASLRMSCFGRWNAPHHMLFQLAHAALLLSFLAPNTTCGFLFLHSMIIVGFLMLCAWAWSVICAPDVFSWNFSFLLINLIQSCFVLYRLRPIRLDKDFEKIYFTYFQQYKVSRIVFKKMVSADCCGILSLNQGDLYATQDVTLTNRLSLLLQGVIHVSCNGKFVHSIDGTEFIDSSEYETSLNSNETFKVSMVAATDCRFICWNRPNLEALFIKEPHLAVVMAHIIGRDITNKLYRPHNSAADPKKHYTDIRMPNISNSVLCGMDVKQFMRTVSTNHVSTVTGGHDYPDFMRNSYVGPMGGQTFVSQTQLYRQSNSSDRTISLKTNHVMRFEFVVHQ